MTHRSWYIKQQNVDRSDLLQISVNAAFALDQLLNKKNDYNSIYLKNGLKLLKILIDNSNNGSEPLINHINLTLREKLHLTPQLLRENILSMMLNIENHNYKSEQIEMFLNIYDAIKSQSNNVAIV
jgi:hypothetical protein